MGGLRLVRGADVTAAQRDRAREVYEDGFPEPWLRVEFDELFVDEVLVGLEGDAVVGLVVARRLADTGWTFIRYFVAGARGQGVGSRLWAALAESRAAEGDSRIVLDVESPDEDGIDDVERDVRLRRIRFYEKNDLVLLPVTGYAPPHGDGPDSAHPMRLLLADLPGPTRQPDPDDLRAVVTGVFGHRYGIRPGHPAVDAALATITPAPPA